MAAPSSPARPAAARPGSTTDGPDPHGPDLHDPNRAAADRPETDRHGPDRPDREPDRLRWTLALAATAGLALAALVLRPTTGLFHGGAAPLSDQFGLLLLLCLGWLVLLERTLRYYRAQVRHLTDLPLRAERLKDAALRLLIAAALGLPVLLLVLHNVDNRDPGPALPPFGRRPPLPVGKHSAPTPVPSGYNGNPGLVHLLLEIGVGGLVLGLLVAVLLIWRRLRQVTVPQLTRVRTAEREPDLAEAIGSARRALLSVTDARTAVIDCYVAMEDSLAASGVERLIADSPTDLLERAVAGGTLRGADARDLTALFHEARFSRHPMGEEHLRRAEAALDAIAAQLAEHAAATAAPDPTRAGDPNGSAEPLLPPGASR
ncbi:DUF4129 domain-containing protein [Kitasatospora sp. LaBMicrA B282]|uniref:DUF4129 domain-containing protein n=1 Tax=Kitasatospora sp. LaBMicrA B282 TaxID=3420949 RepID=UPI003D0966C2